MKRLDILWLFLCVSAAWLASGYHHPDEYMQIVEFAYAKMGLRASSTLPWEYHETMRPWAQPVFFIGIFKFFSLLGVTSPFIILSLYRTVCGLIGFVSLKVLQSGLSVGAKDLGKNQVNNTLMFLFYLPWLMTRGSSEGLTSAFIILAASFLLSSIRKSRLPILSGIFFGLAFIVRFQSGFFVLGTFAWIVFYKKLNFRQHLAIAMSSLAVVLAGIAIDSWGYGHTVFTPWIYFYQNVVLNKASQWGESPFFAYIYLMQQHGGAVISIAITLIFLSSIKYSRNSLWTWMAWTFFIGHSLIGHKEMRFLFPLAAFAPALIHDFTNSQPGLFARFCDSKFYSRFFKPLNVLLLIFFCIWPSRTEVMTLNYLYELNPSHITVVGRSVYKLGDNPIEFVKPSSLTSIVEKKPDEFIGSQRARTLELNSDLVLVSTGGIDFDQLANSVNCEMNWQVYPEWIRQKLNKEFLEKSGDYRIYFCN